MSVPQPAGETEPPQGRREPAFNVPAIVVWLAVACIGIHLLRMYGLTWNQDSYLLLRTAFIPAFYTNGVLDAFSFTSPVTYSFLHGGMAHLGVNMIWLAAFGSPLASRLGALRFLAFWIVTAIAAALLHFAVHPHSEIPLVGASGAISGMMGAAARFGFRIDRRSGLSRFGGPLLGFRQALASRSVLSFLGIWMAINIVIGLFGLIPGPDEASIAWEAHIGGLLAGFFLVALFVPGRDRND